MKKALLFAAVCCFGVQSSIIAQENQEQSKEVEGKGHFYFGAGVAVTSDFNINDKLVMSGAPKLPETGTQLTFGVNYTEKKMLMDIEWNYIFNYVHENNMNVRNIGFNGKLRFHYLPFNNGNTFLGVGGDIAYGTNQFDLYWDGNEIDLNNIYGSSQGYVHKSLFNQQLYVGPSVSFGFFQQKKFPLRLNTGYDWGITNGKWKSEFADVNNTVKEIGKGRFYATLSVYLL